MSSVLVFAGRNAIDLYEFRQQLLRIPEVSLIIKQAQNSLDKMAEQKLDLLSVLQMDSNAFLSSGLVRELCAQLVQVGLYQRFIKKFLQPQFVIGDTSELSALEVCLGRLSLQELVFNYLEVKEQRQQQEQSTDFLVGQRLETAKAFARDPEVQFALFAEGKTTSDLIKEIMKDHLVNQVITLGSAQQVGDTESDIGVVESVAMDPLLSWIVPYVRSNTISAVA